MLFHLPLSTGLSREEIRAKIKKAFEKNKIKDVDFEFAITTTSMIGDDLQSKKYMEAYHGYRS